MQRLTSPTDLKPVNILIHISYAYPRLLIADFGQAATLTAILASVPIDRYAPPTRELGGTGISPICLRNDSRYWPRSPNLQGLGESTRWCRKEADGDCQELVRGGDATRHLGFGCTFVVHLLLE